MTIEEALHILENYNLWLLIIGLAIMATIILPRVLEQYPLSMPMLLLILGYAAIALPLNLHAPNPQVWGNYTEHLTELGVIIALMGAGLKIDRPPSLKGWAVTWRLLGITMVLSIALSAIVGWWFAAFVPATAMLLGAVIAPTDPVLASEVQVDAPGRGSGNAKPEDTGRGKEDSIRFALTSEAGLNDGLAFPFTNMAIAMAIAGPDPGNWIETWLLMDVFYQIAIAGMLGWGLGYLLARFLLFMPAKSDLAKAIIGLGSLSATLMIYGATEYAGGYGFLATFIGAVTIRNYDRKHHYHESLHILIEEFERILTAGILIGLGAAVAGGLLEPLTWPLVLSALVIIFLVRPLAGILGLIGFTSVPWRERLAISFLGIRGIGSLYYLSYALNKEDFSQADEIWALVALIILISIFTHGSTATPITKTLDKLRKQES